MSRKISFLVRTALLFFMMLGISAAIAQQQPSLTIYNQNFAVVRQPLTLDLTQGINRTSVSDITMHLEPDSVILRDPTGKHSLQILEQNYRADPISQGLLLSLNEGKEIDFLVRGTPGEADKIVRGQIIRSGYVPHQSGMQRYGSAYANSQIAYSSAQSGSGQPIVEVDKKLRFSMPGEPLFPSLSDDAILKPTLNWTLQSNKAGKIDAELSYVTGGMSWEADYNVLAPIDAATVDVIGWITMDNQTGKTFDNARIKLMAGDVSKIQPNASFVSRDSEMSDLKSFLPPVSEKTFDEYHLYTLSRPTTLHDRETKQVEFLRADKVKADHVYVYDGIKVDANRYRGYSLEMLRNDREYGTQSNPKIWVMKEIKNLAENGLGIPLPKGRMRFYRKDADGQLEFTGENTIDHTPQNETLRVYTGDAFDLVGERRRTDFKINSPVWIDESFEIKLRNHKEKETVDVRVVEHLYRGANWEIVEKSDTFLKTDSQTMEFRVQVPPGGEKVITYKAHYTW